MNRLLAALLLILACGNAYAQGSGTVPAGSIPTGLGPGKTGWGSLAPGSNGNCVQVAGGVFVSSPCPSTSTPGGSNGQIEYNNAGVFGGFGPITGDITLTVPGAVSTIQPAAVTNGKLAAGADGTVKASSSGAVSDTLLSTVLNTACTLSPSACNTVFGYTSIYWYGAKCDGIFQSNQNFDQPGTNISITSGTNTLTSSGSTFTSGDVTSPQKRVYIPGAGVAGAGLSTTITGFIDATHVTVGTNASTTVTAVAATNAAPFVYGTDDTTAIQNASTGMGTGGTLVIPGKRTGCIIRQQGANTYSILQNKPFTVKGDGHFSNLMTFPDIPSTVDNWMVDPSSGWDWTNVSWTGFSIGMSPSFIPPTFIMYKRYGKRGLAIVDTPAANLVDFNVTYMMIGESSNDYSLHIGNGTSSASQGGNIYGNKIYGGIRLQLVSDSFKIRDNWLFGTSTFGGLFEFVSGAAGFQMSGNNVTWSGCTIIESGTKPVITYNYFEEVVSASVCVRNALVDFNGGTGTVASPTFVGNVVGALVSGTATPVRYSNSGAGIFGDNTITTTTVRTGVTSVVSLNCTAPNTWNTASPHFSTALAQTYGGC